jgi:hypothetical protein
MTCLRAVQLALVTAAMLLAGSIGGCGTDMRTRGFDSPDPQAKLDAIVAAGQTRDKAAIPDLVHQLDSDDPAVRMYAITALQRITGTRLGYSPYAAQLQRQAAVETWVAAVKDGRFARLAQQGGSTP